jgi:hypothetical protein
MTMTYVQPRIISVLKADSVIQAEAKGTQVIDMSEFLTDNPAYRSDE